LLKHLATGQASQVWEVVEPSSHRHFAMKLLLPEKANDAEHRRLLIHEAEVGKLLAHPNIIKIVAFSKEGANPYMVMEFFPAGSLKARLLRKETDFLREKMPDILKQAATGLAFMNAKGWVHRDLKPDNFLVNSAGELRVIDFAIAIRTQKKGLFGGLFRKRGKSQGTRSYMSPEQIRGEPVDGRADIYSFGATCYELVTGRPPFRGASNQDLLQKHILETPVALTVHNPEVTPEFSDLVLRMLAKKKEQRPANFHEVLMALRQVRIFKPAGKPKT
jgi:serine/threonine protein kinase